MSETNIPPENQTPLEERMDKTIDESGLSDPAQYKQMVQGQSDQKAGDAQNPYQQVVLPTGKEPVPLGSGTVVGTLGTGGMAKVYKIWNEKLEVYRAVKVLLPGGQQKELANRFETEAKITAKLHHPNIVEIYSVGEWNNLPYLEMELIEGITLDSLIEKYGRFPDSVCTAIGIQISKALDYAHSQEFLLYGKNYNGIIHRDLKPANIMLSGKGELKLMDFGIARPTEAGLHTMDGHIVGTLQYLSPEQLDGVEIDRRSDIYSFGAILYEVMTGAKTFPQSTITNLMKMKATNSYRKFNELDFKTNGTLAKISEKCLQINRNERYSGGRELQKDFRKLHDSLTSESPHDVLQKYIQEPVTYAVSNVRRKKIPVKLLSAVGGIAAIGGIVLLLLFLFPARTPVQKKTTAQSTESVSRKVSDKETPAEPTKTVSSDITEKVPAATPQRTQVKQKEVEKPRVVTPKKTVKPKARKLSPIASLQKKYGTDDLVTIGEKACKKGRFSDAVTALEAVSQNTPKKSLFLLWAYVELKKTSRARTIAASIQSSDAFVELLKGRIEAASGKARKALNHYEAALTKPSAIKQRILIRNDALYYTAMVHDNHYLASPSADTRLQAITAWNNLKKVYAASPSHPRFKLANKKLAENF